MTHRINPLSRRPQARRLVVAVRGAAGTGKSHFAASLADAGIGRLCLFDVERKGRLLPGASGSDPRFDAIEIHHPDELPEFIDWALHGEGQEQGYSCYALDSWTMYFSRKHRDTVEAVRRASGDPTAEPSADQLQADQILYQEVLRKLCIDSGACVVITDQIAAKGREDREENEMGRVLPMTIGGLEYFVDVLLEMRLEVRDLDTVRVAKVVKSNSAAFPVGDEIDDPSFRDLLDRLDEAPVVDDDIPEFLKIRAVEPPPGPTVDELNELAARHGITPAQLKVAARHYHRVDTLEQLTGDQLRDMVIRIEEKYGEAAAAKGSRKRTAA